MCHNIFCLSVHIHENDYNNIYIYIYQQRSQYTHCIYFDRGAMSVSASTSLFRCKFRGVYSEFFFFTCIKISSLVSYVYTFLNSAVRFTIRIFLIQHLDFGRLVFSQLLLSHFVLFSIVALYVYKKKWGGGGWGYNKDFSSFVLNFILFSFFGSGIALLYPT